ncbi:hypothetical protein WJX72_009659 [[Myrmecia] bisecta]|uniref:Dynamin stalk domain-containing protein n=1 Tax=[Myrmecia] bisecta TaxID=41462 RepID=A0AAW1QG49_9CHLO
MLAEEHDPAKKRTLGVVTKIDLAEKGIRAKLEATGEDDVKLALGIIAVRNRSQDEVEANISAAEALERECSFLDSHPELSAMPRDVLGKPALVNKLVQAKLLQVEADLEKMQGMVESEDEAHRLVFQRLNKLQELFAKLHKGDYSYLKGAPTNDPRRLAAGVWDIFTKFDQKVHSDVGGSNYYLGTACAAVVEQQLNLVRGMALLPNFLGGPVFTSLYHDLVYVEFNTPALDDAGRLVMGTTDGMVQELRRHIEIVLTGLATDVLANFPRLAALVKSEAMITSQKEVFTLNDYYMQTVNKMKEDVQALQAHRIRRSSPGYSGERPSISPQTAEVATQDFVNKLAGAASPKEQAQLEMQFSLAAYAKTVLKRICDDVPLCAKLILVTQVSGSLADDIMERLHKRVRQDSKTRSRFLPYMIDKARALERKRLECSRKNLQDAFKELSTL